MIQELKTIKEYISSIYGQVPEGERYNASEILDALIKQQNDSQKSSVLPSIIITKRSEVVGISNPCRKCGNEVEDPNDFTICMMCYNLEMSE